MADVGGDVENLYLYPIDEYASFLSRLRPDGRLILAAITGPYTPGDEIATRQNTGGVPEVTEACTGGLGDTAMPPVRIHELVRRFGSNGIVLSDLNEVGICADSFELALSTAGVQARHRLMTCAPGPLVNERNERIRSWTEAYCTVEDIANAGRPEEVRTTLARCEFAEGPLAPGGSGACPQGITPLRTPCWYVCDSGAMGDLSCPEQWQLRICRDSTCSRSAAESAEGVTAAACAVCDSSQSDCD